MQPPGASCAGIKHATPAALDRLDDLLTALRKVPGLTERTRGVFYRKSRAFLHFHEDPAGLFADIRGSSDAFERWRVESADEREAFLAGIRMTVAPKE